MEEEPMDMGLPVQSEKNSDSMLSDVASVVFEECISVISQKEAFNISNLSTSNGFRYSWEKILNELQKEAAEEEVKSTWSSSGRIGPDVVGFNKSICVGTLKYDENCLHVCSKDNFSTVLSNVCVYKGKWQYEVMLGTKGVMQIGWSTLNCQFSQENGVGDTPDSYAYDGNRQRKWNVSTHKYGEPWLCGDIITCLIDLDKGEISYLRNGRSLGIAFGNVKLGEGIAYFPAMSLAIDECLTVNFGSAPFHYPQEGFQALQFPPSQSLIIAKACLFWIIRLVRMHLHCHEYKEIMEESGRSRKNVALLIVAQHIGSTLASVLECPYVIESTFVPLLDSMASKVYLKNDQIDTEELQFAHTFISYLMAVLQEDELKRVMSSLMKCLESHHKRVATTLDYYYQKCSLKILLLILTHSHLRKFCLQEILFENYRFSSFVTINYIDKVHTQNVFDLDYYTSKDGEFASGNKELFANTVQQIASSAQELEALQVKVLRLLFTVSDGKCYNETTRALFLAKFRTFLKELFSPRVTSPLIIPSQDILSLFHRCFVLFTQLWEEEVGHCLDEDVLSPSLFYDGVLSYQDIHRLGGLESHLNKTFSQDREAALNDIKMAKEMLHDSGATSEGIVDVNMDCTVPSTSGAVIGDPILVAMEGLKEDMSRVDVTGASISKHEKKVQNDELKMSLLQLLDGVIYLYHHGGHKQVEKIVAQSDVNFENVDYLQDLLCKKEKCHKKSFSEVVQDEFNRSVKVLQTKLKEQSYQHAWNIATALSITSICRYERLLRLVYGALKNSSKQGSLFTYVPEFYVEALAELCQDLRHLVLCKHDIERNRVLPAADTKSEVFQIGGEDLPSHFVEGYRNLLMNVGEFLALHFSDSRIVYADSKDTLIQALAGFVCHKPALEALEKMPLESRLQMVSNLLQPYENRAWAQNNWILVRFWKGKGFGFRYTKSPHLNNKLGPKPAHCELPNIIQSSVPCPSTVFLSHVAKVLHNPEISTPFLNSLLNQLNWVFSEFIGMLQEIQNASNRPERVFIDSRQLRICATCFDLALALLRVLEMIVSIAVNIFVDFARPNSQSLLTRLCQLLCQVLNRVSVGSGCFSHVVSLEIPGLETIHYFPILTAVTGILCQLLRDDVYAKDEKHAQTATSALLSEASFQLSSLYPLLGGKDALTFNPRDHSHPGTSFSQESSVETLDLCQEEPDEYNCVSVKRLFVNPEYCECPTPKFCFRKYPGDIKEYEIKKVVAMVYHLEKSLSALSGAGKQDDSDTLCTICYARTSDAIFEPCHHTSCVPCITHYLMNKSLCFFCKTPIMEVVEAATSKTVINLSGKHEDGSTPSS